MLRELSSKDFQKQNGSHYIKKAKKTGGLVLIHTLWCGFCKTVKPVLQEVSNKLGDAFPVYQLNADAYPDITQALGVQGYPTIFYIDRDGKISGIYDGNRTVKAFLEGICKVSLVCKRI